MSDSNSQGQVRELRAGDESVLMRVVTLGVAITEKGVGGVFGVGRAIRAELFRATSSGVDWVESAQDSRLKIVREVIQRTDSLTQGALDGLEAVTISIAKSIRGSGEAAAELVSSTAETLVGRKRASTKAA